MTPRAAKIRDHAISVGLTFTATLFLTFATGLWSSKENAADHRNDVQALAAKQGADVQVLNAKLERILDVLCQKQPSARACGAGGEVQIP